jgi:hypothetical protein
MASDNRRENNFSRRSRAGYRAPRQPTGSRLSLYRTRAGLDPRHSPDGPVGAHPIQPYDFPGRIPNSAAIICAATT